MKKKLLARSTEEAKKEKRSRVTEEDRRDDSLLTREQAARLLKVSTKTIINREKSGELPSQKNGNTVRILYGDLRKLLNQPITAQKTERLPVEIQQEVNRIGEIIKKKEFEKESKKVDYWNDMLRDNQPMKKQQIIDNFNRFDKALLLRYLEDNEEFALLKQLFGE